MVDNVNPTNQFHPYQPERSTPASERQQSSLGSFLQKMGIDRSRLDSVSDSLNVDVKSSLNKARSYAQANPGKVLGGLAAVAIGAGLWRGRRMT